MRRLKTLMTMCSLIILGQSFAQNLEFELLTRPSLTTLRGNDTVKDNFDPSFNFSGGLGLNYIFKKNSIVSLAILYDKKGGRGESYIYLRGAQNQPIGEGNVTSESNFDYVTIPIQWNQRFGQKIKYQFGAGFYTSFLIKSEFVTSGIGGLADSEEDKTDSYKTLDMGLTASFSIYIPIKESISIKLGLDDNLGLFNISDMPVDNNETIKNNSLGLIVGLSVRLK